EFRDKIDSEGWRNLWDFLHFVVNLVACILLGCAFANLFMGIPVDAKGVYHGSLVGLLNGYGLVGALLFTSFFVMHGALWLLLKTEGNLQIRALAACNFMWPIVLLLLLLFVFLTMARTQILAHYLETPALFALPVIAVGGFVAVRFFLNEGKLIAAFLSHALFIIALTFSGLSGIYPGIILSSLDPNASVTILNGASSTLTLQIMLAVVIVMVPIVIGYQTWMYRLFGKPVTLEDLRDH
ncbi:MAG: cytochrome d ubiquinol oxidase subunit II, partial [Desulfovibrionaceae bacterium]|nr:cytochrome d ubiquinol oxidase subunit II [Desulfovibrionaceae bacterium]